jgi:hypothetical protein
MSCPRQTGMFHVSKDDRPILPNTRKRVRLNLVNNMKTLLAPDDPILGLRLSRPPTLPPDPTRRPQTPPSSLSRYSSNSEMNQPPTGPRRPILWVGGEPTDVFGDLEVLPRLLGRHWSFILSSTVRKPGRTRSKERSDCFMRSSESQFRTPRRL